VARQEASSKTKKRPRAGNGDPATREKVLQATVDSILELGFYRASTNAIARRADVSWGVIQHYFGNREQLLLEVLRWSADGFVARVENAHIDGATAEQRIEQLTEIFWSHYGQPQYLATLQILLNLDHDPETSEPIRAWMRDTAARSYEQIRRLLGEALPGNDELARVVFLAVRGFVLGQPLHSATTPDDRTSAKQMAAERRTFARMLAASLDT